MERSTKFVEETSVTYMSGEWDEDEIGEAMRSGGFAQKIKQLTTVVLPMLEYLHE